MKSSFGSRRFSKGVLILIAATYSLHAELVLAAGPQGAGAVGGLAAAGGGARILGNAVQACARLLGYLEGGFGTLIAAAAGLGAIISAPVGGFKAAWALLVVSIGTFILRTYLTLFLTGCGCQTC